MFDSWFRGVVQWREGVVGRALISQGGWTSRWQVKHHAEQKLRELREQRRHDLCCACGATIEYRIVCAGLGELSEATDIRD